MDYFLDDFVDVRKDGWSIDLEKKYYIKNGKNLKYYKEVLRYLLGFLLGF